MTINQWRSGYRVTPSLDVESLRDNPNFKRAILAELDQQNPEPNLTVLVREYVELVNRIHDTVRTVLQQPLAGWTATFEGAIERGCQKLGDRKHVDAISQEQDGRLVERIAIVKDLVDRITELQRQNLPLNTLSLWYVSSQVR